MLLLSLSASCWPGGALSAAPTEVAHEAAATARVASVLGLNTIGLVNYRTAAAFDRDFAQLPVEHQRSFSIAVRDHFLPAIEAGSFTGNPPWPTRLRIHRLHGTGVYALTWSFSSPDGRATFHLGTDDAGEPVLVWRRIGTHRSYDRP